MLALKNPRTTIPGVIVAIGTVLAGATVDKLTFHTGLALAGAMIVAVGLVLAKDATTTDAPVAPGASK